jgi:hypothetical protein
MPARKSPTTSLDKTRSGSQSYTSQDVAQVERMIRTGTHARPISVAQLVDATGVDGRAVRQIIADYGSGQKWLTATCPDGYFLPTHYEDMLAHFQAARSHIQSAQARLARELAYAEANLDHIQGGLFE